MIAPVRKNSFRPSTAVAVVIANMVGTGVFTSLGFQLMDIQSGFVIILLWLVGGIAALCGALTYAELASALPRSGGEYHFLSRLYHPAAGFISGWISATVGFAAPSALAAITFGKYLEAVFPGLSANWAAVCLILLLTAIHCFGHRSSSRIQSFFTLIKILLILGFCLLAWVQVPHISNISFIPVSGDGDLVLSGAFAVSLVYVNYAYTGWNAATYLTDEVENPRENLPRILFIGTVAVFVLYILLNVTFLLVAPVEAMIGQVEIGYITAKYAFGESGANLMGMILALLLVSTVSAMIMAGPRVLRVIGEDYSLFSWLAQKSRDEIPQRAIVVQSVLSLLMILTASFEQILLFSGFILALNSLFTVAGVFILRSRQHKEGPCFKTPMFPLPPVVYLLITGWTLTYLLMQRPVEGLAGIGMIAAGGLLYKAAVR